MSDKKRGRPSLGITKKISLTLPAEIWDYIENEYSGNSRSLGIRDMLEQHLQFILHESQKDANQIDVFEAIKKAQEMQRKE